VHSNLRGRYFFIAVSLWRCSASISNKPQQQQQQRTTGRRRRRRRLLSARSAHFIDLVSACH